MTRSLYLLCILTLVPPFLLAGETHDDLANKPALDILDADKQLPLSRIVPTLDADHEKGKNLMYCATVQLAWNELIGFLKGDVELDTNPSAAQKLNRGEFKKEMLDDASYYVFAGMGPGAPQRMTEELARKFNGAASPKLIPEKMKSNDFVTYSYLYKNLAFRVPLYAYPNAFRFADGRVKSFGIANENPGRRSMLSSVRIHDHVDDDNFVVELFSTARGDRLLIAKTKPAATLQKTSEEVLARLDKAGLNALEDGEDLRIPVMNFEIVKSFGDLAPLAIRNKSVPQPAELKESMQLIRLKLDEFGAILKSEAKKKGSVGEASIDDGPPPPPRHFICDKPFLILMLLRDQPKPYFALWVDNAELLVKSEAPPDPAAPSAKARRRGSVGLGNVDD